MANLKEIRTRIASVNSTRQITSAMKMVSAAKLRKAQNAIVEMRPYADKLHEILGHVVSSSESLEENPYVKADKKERILFVTISSNRGLCGAFNANVVKKAVELREGEFESFYKSGNIDFITVGKKANDLLKAKKANIVETHHDVYDDLSFENVSKVASHIMQQFLNEKYDEVYLIYNEFKNVAVQVLAVEQFLPVKIEEKEEHHQESDYIFEPNKLEITEQLIPYALKTQFYKAILESHASEHGARMTAMHKATDNATDLLRELRLNYNKARQAAITGEILEIVGGAEALKG
jgi:F-type H+-transporting ATPase subunit gamma